MFSMIEYCFLSDCVWMSCDIKPTPMLGRHFLLGLGECPLKELFPSHYTSDFIYFGALHILLLYVKFWIIIFGVGSSSWPFLWFENEFWLKLRLQILVLSFSQASHLILLPASSYYCSCIFIFCLVLSLRGS